MIEFKGALFDLDGTVIDSMGVWNDVDAEFFARHGIVMPGDYQLKIATMKMPQAAEYTRERFGIGASAGEILEEWLGMVRVRYEESIGLKPYAGEYVRFLRDSGVKLCTASSLPDTLFVPCLRRLGLLDLFDEFALVNEVPRGKDNPDLFLLAVKKLGLPPDRCILYDDLHECMISGHEAGLMTCGVYDSSASHCERLVREHSDRYIYSFAEELERYRGRNMVNLRHGV